MAVFAATSDSDEEGANNWKPRPYVMTPFKVVITQNGAWSDLISGDETRAACAKFVLKRRDVVAFFRQARRASYQEYGHDLDMSRCHVNGRIEFANGDKGDWQIDLERRGMIALKDGRQLYFYCPKCRTKVFDKP